ncbi:MAG: Beta-lactamase-like [uncultured Sulfurovum sp.]|uniref:Beta-lactamase-like n=1 Tax=uncultured Sulfurovum sp. TaxID=269237 RepID=A0A6S6TXB4_9BACT|nr:MAG: Beta-lactamase-like [uncultured Sulfurovum sp.]
MRYVIVFFFSSVYLFAFNYHLKPYKISDGIHCFFGIPSQVSNLNGGNMINSCYVETRDGYVVIDSGPTYSYAQEAYAVMKKKNNLPVKYVINTSWDEVHVLGNEFYKEMGAQLVGPKGYKKNIEGKDELFLKKKLTQDALINTRVVSLDTYVENELKLKFTNMEIVIQSLRDDNHLYVYIEDKEIVFAGDLIFNNRITPIKYTRSITKWLKDIDKLSNLKWQDVISSHGYMSRRSALENTKNYLALLKKEVLAGIEDGLSKEEIIEKVKLLSFSEDRLYDIWHPRNVASAYEELKNSLPKKKDITDEMSIIESRMLIELEKSKFKEPSVIPPKLEPQSKKIVEPLSHKQIEHKVPRLQYKSFESAINIASEKKKIVLIKVRSTVCKYCDQLERVISKNIKVKKILNKYFELVEINVDHETLPMNLSVRSTPTLIFIEPSNQKVLMQLAGIRALGELLEVLNEAVVDGHNDGYLRP